MTRKPYTPERAYRVSVVPLSIFMAVCGIAFAAVSVVWEGERFHMPPLGAGAGRAVFGAIGLYLVLVGVGMLYKIRIAWYGLFAYLIIGGLWNLVLSVLFTVTPPPEGGPGVSYHLVGTVVPLLMAVGLYVVTRPAFTSTREHQRGSGGRGPESSGPLA